MTDLSTYGSVGGTLGSVHDWYLIILALVVLYLVMRYFPEWGIPLGFVILLGAVLATPAGIDAFNSLVNRVKVGPTGGLGGNA